MSIPIWLIVVGVIVWFIYARKKEKVEQSIPLTPEEEESEASLRKISKHWQHESDVNAFFDLEKIDQVLKQHEDKILKIKDNVNEVRREREALDNALMFSQRLWQFVDDVKYYPSWYENSKKQDKEPHWKSKAIQPNELLLKKFSKSKLSELLKQSDKFSKDDDILEYSFEVNGNKYTLFINKEISRQENNHFGSNDKWEPIYYYPAFVYENEQKLVYEAKLFYESGEYTDSYDHYDLEAFKPSQWTKFLLGKIFAIRAEEEQSSKEFREKMNKDMEEKNKEKFVD
jgi:hypothetical protein